MTNLIKVDRAKGVCEYRSKLNEVISAYTNEKSLNVPYWYCIEPGHPIIAYSYFSHECTVYLNFNFCLLTFVSVVGKLFFISQHEIFSTATLCYVN
jgi:hypothetical protein